MATKKIKFWMGSQGPFLFEVDEDNPESPFRFENAQTNKVERVVTRESVAQAARITSRDPHSGAEYAAAQAAHTYAFKLAEL